MDSPASPSGGVPGKHVGLDLSPQSVCSSPSLSRLTYISMNDVTVIPTPERQKVRATLHRATVNDAHYNGDIHFYDVVN